MGIRSIVAAGVVGAALLLGTGQYLPAQDAQPGLSASGTIGEALAKLAKGREVEIVLGDGKSYRGKIAEVGTQTVLLTQIAGKEFYDVLVNLDAIAAVEVRAR